MRCNSCRFEFNDRLIDGKCPQCFTYWGIDHFQDMPLNLKKRLLEEARRFRDRNPLKYALIAEQVKNIILNGELGDEKDSWE